ncbi:hypothetical protein DFQ10_1118 [Winogradskyella eximia]|uniref:Uncharacterized protein n=1 Tax=Winogradskyella eximia TaxID=262006 RepID=A0A3D9GPZ8_9FLAO|nr:hypothetical protein [Winogradskyella eximia]RED38187.1 hypothetical protein DFQ10_1118 [Winogradskyella eximia]
MRKAIGFIVLGLLLSLFAIILIILISYYAIKQDIDIVYYFLLMPSIVLIIGGLILRHGIRLKKQS